MNSNPEPASDDEMDEWVIDCTEDCPDDCTADHRGEE